MESEVEDITRNDEKFNGNSSEKSEEEVCSNNVENEEKEKSVVKKMLRFKFSYDDLVKFMYKPIHPASLAFTRILFGLLMLVDIIDERGGAYIDIRWGEPKNCYFPLFPQLIRPPLPWMCVLYGVMWLGALGITLGYRFKISCISFVLPYWYILLLEKSFWNNHSYLFGLVGILFIGTSANNYWSLDVVFKNVPSNLPVPQWNYFILKFQFFILYFFAGLKKTDMEWLEGYSMLNLGSHWVFQPFTLIFDLEVIDYFIVHMSGFLLDLSLGFLLLCSKTRPIALLFGGMFHIMNTRLFSIGMFPYVCLAAMPIFCDANWPIKIINKLRSNKKTETFQPLHSEEKPSLNHHLTLFLISLHCCLQIFLPYSHFITKGYNNWTNGLYGYSWDMMVHSWDTSLVVVRIVDNNTGKEHFLDPGAWTHNERWSKHADMCVQYAHCLKKNLLNETKNDQNSQISEYITSDNLSIYIDVWCSLNGRFQQRMYNPNYDLLKANWSPFEKVEWLLPLLTEYSGLRETMREIQEHVYTWSNYSDVLFIADFPGLYLENFITPELINVTLTVIEGEVYFEPEDNYGTRLKKGASIPIVSDVFHRIFTISDVPSCFMYTYTNKTRENLNEESNKRFGPYSPFPLLEDGEASMEGFLKMLDLIGNSILNIIYEVPMVRRTELYG